MLSLAGQLHRRLRKVVAQHPGDSVRRGVFAPSHEYYLTCQHERRLVALRCRVYVRPQMDCGATMTPIEIFETRKADVLQTKLDIAKLANPPFDAEPRRQLAERLERQCRSYDAALAALRDMQHPMGGIDLLRR